MNKLTKIATVVALSAVVAGSAFASDSENFLGGIMPNYSTSGFYLGGQLGWAKAHDNLKHLGSTFAWNSADFNRNNITGGAFAGYNFNQYLAAELGYEYFQGGKVQALGYIPGAISTTGSATPLARTYAINKRLPANMVDLVGRFNLPLSNYLTAYVKGGGAWVHTGSISINNIKLRNSQNQIRPVGAVGLEYHVTKNVGIDAQYMRVFGGSKIASYDAVTGGLTYYFS